MKSIAAVCDAAAMRAPSFAVHARDLDVAVIDLVGEMRGGARCFAASDLTVVNDEDFLSFERQQISCC